MGLFSWIIEERGGFVARETMIRSISKIKHGKSSVLQQLFKQANYVMVLQWVVLNSWFLFHNFHVEINVNCETEPKMNFTKYVLYFNWYTMYVLGDKNEGFVGQVLIVNEIILKGRNYWGITKKLVGANLIAGVTISCVSKFKLIKTLLPLFICSNL